jgi:hypothetical protein
MSREESGGLVYNPTTGRGDSNMRDETMPSHVQREDFFPVKSGPTIEQVIRSRGYLWNLIRDIFDHRFGPSNLAQAMITFIAMVSGYLGEGLALFLSCDRHGNGHDFIKTVGRLVPKKIKSEHPDLSIKIKSVNTRAFQGNTIIAFAADGTKTCINKLRMLVNTSSIVDVDVEDDFGWYLGQPGRKSVSTGLIVLVGTDNSKGLRDFPAIRINISNNLMIGNGGKNARYGEACLQNMEKKILMEILRLKHKRVDIPFWDKIVAAIKPENPEGPFQLSVIEKCLKIIAMINSARFYCDAEAGILLNNFDMNTFLPRLSGACPMYADHLVCSVADYEVFYSFGHELFRCDIETVSEKDRSVFEATKRINFRAIEGLTLQNPYKSSERDIIKTLNYLNHPEAWASAIHIREEINRHEGKTYSPAQIQESLDELMKKQLLVKKNGHTGELVYRINTLTISSRPILPHPSEIRECGNGAKVKLLAMDDLSDN